MHQPITAARAGDVALLPPYVRRAHDHQVAKAMQRAAEGLNPFVLLVRRWFRF